MDRPLQEMGGGMKLIRLSNTIKYPKKYNLNDKY